MLLTASIQIFYYDDTTTRVRKETWKTQINYSAKYAAQNHIHVLELLRSNKREHM